MSTSAAGPAAQESVRRANLVAGLVQVCLAVYAIVESRKFPPGDAFQGPGAGFLPFWVGVVWLPVAVALIWQSRRRPAAGESPPIPRGSEGRRLLLFVLLLAAFMVAFEPAGALISLTAFVTAALYLFEDYPWRRALLTGLAISGVLYLTFGTWLGVPLPRGPLFFL